MFEQRPVVFVGSCQCDSGCSVEPRLVDVADRRDLDVISVGQSDQRLQMRLGICSRTDDADSDSVVGSEHATRPRGRGRR